MITLSEQLGVTDADEDDLYEAMDWRLDISRRVRWCFMRIMSAPISLSAYWLIMWNGICERH